MRASCSICQELFTTDCDICAVPCGHVFHMECVKPWFAQNNTCPQCRNKVQVRNMIKKLYFTETEVEDAEVDSSRLKNELDSLRLRLRDRDTKLKDSEKEHQKQQERVSALRESIDNLQRIYKVELTKNSTLKKELLSYKSQHEEAERARQEAVQLRHKLKQLSNLDSLRNGLMSDIEDRARNASAKDLVEWVVIQDKEMKRKRQECRELLEQKDRLGREYRTVKKVFETKTKDYSVLEEKLRISEEDFKNMEKQNCSLKKKLDTLQKSIASPSGVSSSLAYRMINESPAPMPPPKRPRLSEPGPEFNMDLNETGSDLFSPSPDRPLQSKPKTQQKHDCKEYGTKYIKITSASSSFKTEKHVKKDLSDISNVPVTGFNILKKRGGSGLLQEKNSAIRTGYNGLGGHEKFIQAKPFSKGVTSKKGLLSKGSRSVFMPPLPKMDL